MIHIPPQLFALGGLLITPRAQAILRMAGVSEWTLLFAHGAGSTVPKEDREQFDHAVEEEREIVSYHVIANGARIAVRTNGGHAETVVMLAEEISESGVTFWMDRSGITRRRSDR